MTTRVQYQQTLDKLATLLKRKPMTAKAIATELDCCRPVAYQRVEALKKRGEHVYMLETRESVTGPTSLAYGIR